MEAQYPVLHALYEGNTDAEGYPTAPQYGDDVQRLVFLVQPDMQNLTETDEKAASRSVVRLLIGVPSVAPYNIYDRITVDGEQFRIEEIRDMTKTPFTLPFGQTTLGALIVERTKA